MKKLRVVHLVDDFAAGGVAQALSIYGRPELADIACSRVEQVDPNSWQAPYLNTDMIVPHFPPRWRSLAFLYSLRRRNPNARLVHVEHSYTRAWERANVPHQWRFRLMLRWSLRHFDQVVAVSHGQADWLESIGVVPGQRLRVIAPYSDIDPLLECPRTPRAPNAPIVIGAFGRFAEVKGFERLIDVFARLDPARFVLRIGGFGPLEDALKARAQGMAHVEFVGPVIDRAAFLSACDMLAVPSRWESFGLVAAEARAAGCPILVSNVDGLPEQARGRGYVFDFDDTKAVADAIAAVNRSEIMLMGALARQSVRSLSVSRFKAWREIFEAAAPAAAG
ncbi:glycosyltransferase [Salinisphaera sp. T5B8]|uniref:glycosyltransferase family 4 protein n=1 Tax=unclassified Salinisphaera TaxID=2649847 RepID=UPI003342BA30